MKPPHHVHQSPGGQPGTTATEKDEAAEKLAAFRRSAVRKLLELVSMRSTLKRWQGDFSENGWTDLLQRSHLTEVMLEYQIDHINEILARVTTVPETSKETPNEIA